MASLFKRAAIRGVAHELVKRGFCEFPSKEAMDGAADAVADGPAMAQAPEVSPEQGHSPEELAAAAQKLMEIAHALMQEAQGGAAGGPPGMPPPGADAGGPPGGGMPPPGAGGPPPPEAAKQAALTLKQAALETPIEELASEAAVGCMDKAASEKQGADSKLVGVGGDHSNKLTDSAKNDSVGKLDEKHRPQGKYVTGVGNTHFDSEKGAIGSLGKPTVEPSKSPSGTNSVNDNAKKAALREILEKHANKLVGLHEPTKNNLANSPDTVAQLDAKHRGEGYAHVGQGNANFSEEQAARIGVEKKPTVAPTLSPSGSNSVIAASHAGSKKSEDLSEKDAAYLAAFEKCASDVGPYLPPTLNEEEKVAAIDAMISLDHGGREAKLQELHKVANEAKTAETKKESTLLSRVREIAVKATQPAA